MSPDGISISARVKGTFGLELDMPEKVLLRVSIPKEVSEDYEVLRADAYLTPGLRGMKTSEVNKMVDDSGVDLRIAGIKYIDVPASQLPKLAANELNDFDNYALFSFDNLKADVYYLRIRLLRKKDKNSVSRDQAIELMNKYLHRIPRKFEIQAYELK